MKPAEPADIVIYIQGKGIVLREKSLVAFDTADKKILAFGTEAQRQQGIQPENVIVTSPLAQGKIADFAVSVALFRHLLHKAWGKKPVRKPSVAICVPEDITEVEKKAAEDVLYVAGAGKVVISDMPLEQFLEGFSKSPVAEEYRKINTVIGITKEEPERYVAEQLQNVLRYAGQEGISAENVRILLEKMISLDSR